MDLTTDTQLAEQFGISLEKLHELRKRHHWPHVRLGRFGFRFTDEQIRQIVAQHSAEAPGKSGPAVQPSVKVAGQTARSAARRRSA